MPTEKPRFMVTVSDELRRQIDDYRFDNRYRSQSQAIVELIQAGLDSLFPESSEKKEQPANNGLSETESRFIELYSQLDTEGRDLVDCYLSLPSDRRHLLAVIAKAILSDPSAPPDPQRPAP